MKERKCSMCEPVVDGVFSGNVESVVQHSCVPRRKRLFKGVDVGHGVRECLSCGKLFFREMVGGEELEVCYNCDYRLHVWRC